MKGKKIVFDDIKPSRVRKGSNPKVRRTKVHEPRKPQHEPQVEDGLREYAEEDEDSYEDRWNAELDAEEYEADLYSPYYTGEEDWY